MKNKLKPCPFCGEEPAMDGEEEAYCENSLCPIINIPIDIEEWNDRPIEECLETKEALAQ